MDMKPSLPALLLSLVAVHAFATGPATPSPDPAEVAVPLSQQLGGSTPPSITGNPAADNVNPGTGLAGRLLKIPEDTGLRFGGVWLGDTNTVLSGSSNPGRWLGDSLLILGANLDAEKLVGWKGASFGVQFLQFNAQSANGLNANGLAGSVQGYNSLPGPAPLNRSELYQLWYRQSLDDDRVIFRIGKQVPTYDFNNLARPAVTDDETLSIPSVTGLMYTPVFVNPTLLGAIGGYYNSVTGFTISVAPTKNSYVRYGVYDGNVADGKQTGLTGPDFNSHTFNIGEAGVQWILADKYPGSAGAGLWYQTGVLTLSGPHSVSQDGTGGFYLFGSQRLWSNQLEKSSDASTKTGEGLSKSAIETKSHTQNASISTFLQYGTNNAETLPMTDSIGMGFTGFGLVPYRPADSMGIGMSEAWLNRNIFNRNHELMFQFYYQAHLVGSTFFQPGFTYIPTPGANPDHSSACALTLRVMVLF